MEEPAVYKLYLQPGMKLILVGVLVIIIVISTTLTAWPLLKPGPKAPPLPLGLIWDVIAVVYLLYFLSLPHRITFANDGTVEFISLLRRRTVRAEEIKSIKPAGSQFGFLLVRTGQGKIRLLSQFDDFHDFLTRLKARHPGVELRGC